MATYPCERQAAWSIQDTEQEGRPAQCYVMNLPADAFLGRAQACLQSTTYERPPGPSLPTLAPPVSSTMAVRRSGAQHPVRRTASFSLSFSVRQCFLGCPPFEPDRLSGRLIGLTDPPLSLLLLACWWLTAKCRQVQCPLKAAATT
eukprot:jgi/Botrbrau1/19892/Bobra.0059s0013.1